MLSFSGELWDYDEEQLKEIFSGSGESLQHHNIYTKRARPAPVFLESLLRAKKGGVFLSLFLETRGGRRRPARGPFVVGERLV